jgi:4'-phosphopantetheinyl transferase
LFNTATNLFSIRQINASIRLGLLNLKTLLDEHPGLSQRELERRGTELLLSAMFNGEKVEISYDANNKPHIKSGLGHISISHSHDRLAIIHNLSSKTGVGIELIRDKVIGIQHKFLNEEEQKWANNTIETLVCFWAVKETLYKIHGLKGLDFKKNLFIEHMEADRILASIKTPGATKQYALIKEKTDDYILVYAEKEIR